MSLFGFDKGTEASPNRWIPVPVLGTQGGSIPGVMVVGVYTGNDPKRGDTPQALQGKLLYLQLSLRGFWKSPLTPSHYISIYVSI